MNRMEELIKLLNDDYAYYLTDQFKKYIVEEISLLTPEEKEEFSRNELNLLTKVRSLKGTKIEKQQSEIKLLISDLEKSSVNPNELKKF